MNLVQIQERLKGMPIQALMAYANGMNPSVPPYLALGELNRRKQAEQSAQKPEVPLGTVKDKVENEAGLMALKKQAMDQMNLGALRQQQVAQGQAAQTAMMPQAVPPGAPEPQMQEEVEMADGGIATINVPDFATSYGSGGIIAFADEGLVRDPMGTGFEEITSAAEGKPDSRNIIERLLNAPEEPEWKRKIREEEEAARRARTRQVAPVAEPAPEPAPVSVPVRAPVQRPAPVRAPGIMGTNVAQVSQPAQPAPVAPTPQVAQPAPAAGPNFMEMLAKQATGEGQQSYEQKLAAAAQRDPYLNKQPGEMMEQYLKRMEERQAGEQSRQKELEQERARSALWRSLIAAGEASRGTRGIGALMAGFGKTAGEELEAGRVREEAQMKARREFEDNMAKMRQEIENARIARSQGRFKDALEHDRKAEERRDKAIEKGADIQSTKERDVTKFANDQEMARIRFEYDKKLKGIPQAQRLSLEEQYVEEMVKAGKPRSDAIREAKLLGTAGTKGVMTRDQAEDNFRKDMENFQLAATMKDEAKKYYGRDPSYSEMKEYFIQKQMGASSGAAPTGGVARPQTQAELDKLPSGTRFINPADGKEFIKK